MAKVTIELDGVTRVIEGAIIDISEDIDIASTNDIYRATRHERTGRGKLSVTILYTNGARD